MREREREIGGGQWGFDEFAEWIHRSGRFVGVGLRNGFFGFRVEFEQEKMEGTTKLEGTTCRCFGHCSTNELGIGWVEDEFNFGWIRVK